MMHYKEVSLVALCVKKTYGIILLTDLTATEEMICASFPVISTVKFVSFFHSIDFSQHLYHVSVYPNLFSLVAFLSHPASAEGGTV